MKKATFYKENLNLLKEFQNSFKLSLKSLNKAFGIDYNKPFKVFKKSSNFTTKQIQNLFLNNNNDIIYLVLKNKFENVKFCEISHDGVLNINVNNQVSRLSKFYTKTEFEQERKQCEKCFIFVINKEYLTKKSSDVNPYNDNNYLKDVFENDKNMRFIPKDFRMWYNPETKSESGISNLEVYRKGSKNRCLSVKNMIRNTKNVKSIFDILDKNGYRVDKKRDDLKMQASALRVKRAKEKELKTDYSKQVSELKEMFNAEIKNALNIALNMDFIENKKASKIISLVNNFSWQYSSMETLTNKIVNHEFASIKQIENYFNEKMNDLQNFKNKLQEILQND